MGDTNGDSRLAVRKDATPAIVLREVADLTSLLAPLSGLRLQRTSKPHVESDPPHNPRATFCNVAILDWRLWLFHVPGLVCILRGLALFAGWADCDQDQGATETWFGCREHCTNSSPFTHQDACARPAP